MNDKLTARMTFVAVKLGYEVYFYEFEYNPRAQIRVKEFPTVENHGEVSVRIVAYLLDMF